MLANLRLQPASQLLNLCCSLFLTDIAYQGQNSSYEPNSSTSTSTLEPWTNSECRRVFDRNGYLRVPFFGQMQNFDSLAPSTGDIDRLDPFTRSCIPRTSTCCFLQVLDVEFDAFTSRPHYIYGTNPNYSTLVSKAQLSQLRQYELSIPICPTSAHAVSGSSIKEDDTDTGSESSEDGEGDGEPPENCLPPIEEIPFMAPIWYLREPWEIAVKTCATLPIAIVAILGNTAVIRIILKNKLTRNTVNQFILNMSIADLLNALIFPWVFLVTDFYQIFMLGKVICEYHSTLLNTLMLTSIFSLCAISFDRLTAVVFPFRKKMSPRTAKYVIYAIWIAAIGTSAPLVLWREYVDRQWLDFREIFCNDDRGKSRIYWLILISVLFWLPIGVMVVSYTGIIIKLHFLEKQHEDHGQKSQIKAKSKVIWMFFLVLIAFIICWTPFTVVVYVRDKLIADKNNLPVPEWLDHLLFASHVLMITNSAVNPIIYGFKNENLRRGFRSVVPSCCKRQSKIEVSTIMAGKNQARHAAHAGAWGSSSPRGDPSMPTGPHEDIFNNAMKNAHARTSRNLWEDQPPPYGHTHEPLETPQAPPQGGRGRGSAGSIALQFLAKTRKYYESILFANNNACTEKASLNSYERRDSALADLGLPIPGSPPSASSGSGCNSGCTASSNSPTASTTVEHI